MCAVDVFSRVGVSERFTDNHTCTASMVAISIIGLRAGKLCKVSGISSSLGRPALRPEMPSSLTDVREVGALRSHLRLRLFTSGLHLDVNERLLSGCDGRQRVLWRQWGRVRGLPSLTGTTLSGCPRREAAWPSRCVRAKHGAAQTKLITARNGSCCNKCLLAVGMYICLGILGSDTIT